MNQPTNQTNTNYTNTENRVVVTRGEWVEGGQNG